MTSKPTLHQPRRNALPLAVKGMILLSLPLTLQVVLTIWLTSLLWQAEQTEAKFSTARILCDAVNAVTDDVRDIMPLLYETFDYHVDTSSEVNVVIDRLNTDFERLETLTRKSKKDREVFERLNRARIEMIEFVTRVTQHPEVYATDKVKTADDKLRLKDFASSFYETASIGQRASQLLERSPAYYAQESNTWKIIILIFFAGIAFLMLFLGLFFSRQIIAPVNLIIDNSRRLAVQEPLNERLGPGDEIADLDNAFHRMAEVLSEASRKQRASITYASDMICSLDHDGTIVDVNNASQSLIGVPPQELIDNKLTDFIFHEDRAYVLGELAMVIEGGSEPSFEARMVRSDQKLIDVVWSAIWSKEDGTIFCIAHDITQRKQAERLQKEVMQMVSHDLRSPLNAIQGIFELFRSGVGGNLEEEANNLLSIADRNADLMLTLINDILDIERLEAGKLELNKEPVSVRALFEQAAQTVRVQAAQRNIEIKFTLDDFSLIADGDRLVQVLSNLLTNAVKFSPERSTIELRAKNLGQSVEFEVIDQGRGIPSHMLSSIFDRFSQVQSSDSRQADGKGLGLAICKALVELHGGYIAAVSEPGQGSTFVFSIPTEATRT